MLVLICMIKSQFCLLEFYLKVFLCNNIQLHLSMNEPFLIHIVFFFNCYFNFLYCFFFISPSFFFRVTQCTRYWLCLMAAIAQRACKVHVIVRTSRLHWYWDFHNDCPLLHIYSSVIIKLLSYHKGIKQKLHNPQCYKWVRNA